MTIGEFVALLARDDMLTRATVRDEAVYQSFNDSSDPTRAVDQEKHSLSVLVESHNDAHEALAVRDTVDHLDGLARVVAAVLLAAHRVEGAHMGPVRVGQLLLDEQGRPNGGQPDLNAPWWAVDAFIRALESLNAEPSTD